MYEQMRKKLIALKQKAQKEMSNCQQLKNRKRKWIAYQSPQTNYNRLNQIKRTSPEQQNKPQQIREINSNILSEIKVIAKEVDIKKEELLQKQIVQIKLQNSNLKQRISQLLDDLSKQEEKQNIILQQYETYKAETEQKLKYFEDESIKSKSNKQQLENLIFSLKEALRQMEKRLNQETVINRHLREQNQSYEKKIKSLQIDNIKFNDILTDKLKLIQNLNIEIEQMEEKYENQNKQINNIKQQMQKLRKKVQDCLNEKQHLQYDKQNLQKQFQEKLHEKQTLEQSMTKEIQHQRQINQIQSQQKANQIQHLKKQLNEKIQKLKQDDQQKEKQQLNFVKEKDATIQILNQNIILLKTQILQYIDKFRKQENQMKDLEVEIYAIKIQKKQLQQNLQRQLDFKYQQQNIRLKECIHNQEIQIHKIKNYLEQTKIKNEVIQTQMEKIKEENQKLKKDNNQCGIEKEKILDDKKKSEQYFETLIDEKDILINSLQQQKENFKFQMEMKEDTIKQLTNQIEAKANQIKLQNQQKQANLLNLVKQKDIVIDSLNQAIDTQNIIIQEQNQQNNDLKQEIEKLKLSLIHKCNQIHQLNSLIESIKSYQQQNILMKQEIDQLKISSNNKDRQIQQLKININDKLISLNQKDEERQRLYELYHLLSIKQELDYQISSPIMDRIYSPDKRKIASISPCKQKMNQNSYLQNSIPFPSNLCISLNYTYEILKRSYLIMQAKYLLLSTDLSCKYQQNQVLKKQIEDNEIELTNLQNKIKIYQDQVNHMNFRINQLQGIIPQQEKEQEEIEMQENNIQNDRKAINIMNNNQPDTEGQQKNIKNIQSVPNQSKLINYFQLTPIDLKRFKRYEEAEQNNLNLQQIQSIKLGSSPEREPFIKIKESNSSSNPSNSNQNLNGDKNKQQDNNYIYENQGKQHEVKKIGTKCSLQFINQNIAPEQFQDKQKSQDLIVPKQRNNDDIQKQQNKSSLSLQNNPDTEITFTYQQLKEKYRLLIIEYQKMSEYLCRIHNINYNWKKNSHDIQQLSKVNVLSKLSQRLTFLITHKQKTGIYESQQFIGELNKIILDLQSYIHFLDHLIKIQPFQDYKYPYPFKKLNKKLNDNVKYEKQIIQRKTRSQGGSYNDELVQNFDIYPFESDDIPQNKQKQMAQTRKQKEIQKQIAQFQKYCEQNKQFLSEISSVKNQSQQSQFINSKSQLGHLLNANKPSEEIQVNSRFTLNKNDFYDSDKLSHLPFKEVVYLYYQIKQNMVNLINQKNNIEKQLKKQIQQKQYDCKKKINQITKQFNQSFGLLCLRSGKHLTTKTKDKSPNFNEVLDKGSQKIIARKITHSKTLRQNEVKYKHEASGNEELNFDQLNQKQQIIRQLTSEISKNIERIKELQKTVAILNEKNEHLHCIINLKDKQMDVERIIVQQNLTQFINKLVSKIHFGQKIIPSLILHKNNIFRKNSSSLHHNQVLLATRISELPLKIQQVLDTIGFYLKNQQLRLQKKDLSKKQLEQILAKSISRLQKSFYQEILLLIKRQLQLLTKMEVEQWSMQLQGIRLTLKQKLNNNQIIDEMYNQLNLLINKLKGQNENSVQNISIYSKQDEKKQNFKKENEYEEESTKYIQLKNEKNNYIMQVEKLKTQNQGIKQNYSKLSEELMLKQELVNQQTKEINNCNELIKSLRDCSSWQELIKAKQKEIQFMQEEILALRGQISKMKQKSNKKTKIFYVQH